MALGHLRDTKTHCTIIHLLHRNHTMHHHPSTTPIFSDAVLMQMMQLENGGLSADLEAARFVADLMARIIANGLHLDQSLQ